MTTFFDISAQVEELRSEVMIVVMRIITIVRMMI